jgi:hypothetical protein
METLSNGFAARRRNSSFASALLAEGFPLSRRSALSFKGRDESVAQAATLRRKKFQYRDVMKSRTAPAIWIVSPPLDQPIGSASWRGGH